MQSKQCISCKHFLGGTFCKAFQPIPEDIQLGRVAHNKPIKGDNGYQYEISEHYKTEDDPS